MMSMMQHHRKTYEPVLRIPFTTNPPPVLRLGRLELRQPRARHVRRTRTNGRPPAAHTAWCTGTHASAAARLAALSAQGEGAHLFAHERRPVANRSVGP